jgi:hypothetical protein
MTTGKENLLKRIENVQHIVKENYKPGDQKRCKVQAYRRNVMSIYPMSERTFWRYMSADVSARKDKGRQDDPKQLKLDF